MISQRAKYALRALVALVKAPPESSLMISEISKAQAIPKKFLEQILLSLKNKGILHSKKGRGGGYSLGRPPDRVSLGEVIRTLDGSLAPVPCVSQSAYRTCEECHDEATCGIRAVMQSVRDSTAQILDRESLANMLKHEELLEQKKNKAVAYAI